MADYEAVNTPMATVAATGLRKRVLNITVDEEWTANPKSYLHQTQDGTHEAVEIPSEDRQPIIDKLAQPKVLLGQWMATAVCGNDVLSSCSYSSGVVALQAGVLSFAGFCVVSLCLFMYRFVYEEVVTAIPLNGGSYNALLNTTSKRFAAVASCLSILCYMATAVISATTGVNYMTILLPNLNVVWTTVGVLGAFAILMLIGIKESAIVSTIMFFTHIITLTILCVASIIYTIKNPDIITSNFHNVTYPEVNYMGTTLKGDIWTALFFGFSAAMLGVTGFETSSNFIEEQQPGVFGKTMRNMWAITSLFNISIAVLTFGVLKMEGDDGIIKNSNYVLAQMGLVACGKWAQTLVVLDAFFVLCGAVLTSFVGINGLVRRLASDRVMPQFLIQKNKLRGTCHWIIISFFLIASSLVIILDADQTQMAGVYTYSFMSMMFLFATGCILLKLKRQDIPRQVHAPWWCIIFGMTLVFIGFLGNLLGNPKTLMYFVSYFIFVLLVVFGMLERVFLLRVLVVVTNLLFKDKAHRLPAEQVLIDNDELSKTNVQASPALEQETSKVSALVRNIKAIKNAPVVFFIKRADLVTLNKAILYVRANESTHILRFVHVYPEQTVEALETVEQLKEMIAMYDRVYPKLQLDFYSIVGEFDPVTVEWISQTYGISTNSMFL
ncbi:hypothetical protein As57867_007517, partial [Aphanomyces stellatus]